MRARFAGFVDARGGVLWRTAWLLTGEQEAADELLLAALADAWVAAPGLETRGSDLEQHTLASLVRASSRRPAPLPHADDGDGATRSSLELAHGLAQLTPGQRAAVVLLHAELRTLDEAVDLTGHPVEVVRDDHDGAVTILRDSTLLRDPAEPATDPGVAGPSSGPLQDGERYWLRRRLTEDVPDPPYAPGRAAQAARRGRTRGRRALLAGAVVLVVLGALAGASVLADDGGDDAAVGDPTSRQLVDGLPIPDRCTDVPRTAPEPDLPLDLDEADVVWLRFCPARDRGAPGSLGFVPRVTVVSGLDGMVERWVAPQAIVCPYRDAPAEGAVRIQLGTADGALHVVDLDVGACGEVRMDGVRVSLAGREVFSDAVLALGSQRLGEMQLPGEVSGEPRCPIDPLHPGTAGRVTLGGYPDDIDLETPLPAMSALVCQYLPRPGDALPRLIDTHMVYRTVAEQLRAAYLARRPPSSLRCGARAPATLYAAVLVDATSSWRAFGVDGGHCAEVVGPAFEAGWSGRWLLEALRLAMAPPASLEPAM